MNPKSQTVITTVLSFDVKERTIRKLVGGAGEVKKNIRKGKLKEKKFMHAN